MRSSDDRITQQFNPNHKSAITSKEAAHVSIHPGYISFYCASPKSLWHHNIVTSPFFEQTTKVTRTGSDKKTTYTTITVKWNKIKPNKMFTVHDCSISPFVDFLDSETPQVSRSPNNSATSSSVRHGSTWKSWLGIWVRNILHLRSLLGIWVGNILHLRSWFGIWLGNTWHLQCWRLSWHLRSFLGRFPGERKSQSIDIPLRFAFVWHHLKVLRNFEKMWTISEVEPTIFCADYVGAYLTTNLRFKPFWPPL